LRWQTRPFSKNLRAAADVTSPFGPVTGTTNSTDHAPGSIVPFSFDDGDEMIKRWKNVLGPNRRSVATKLDTKNKSFISHRKHCSFTYVTWN
jgi:hypothetical protein